MQRAVDPRAQNLPPENNFTFPLHFGFYFILFFIFFYFLCHIQKETPNATRLP